MAASIAKFIASYDPTAPLERAATIPSTWYTNERILELERQSAFARSWQYVGPIDHLAEPGDYLTADVAGEPVVVVCGADGVLRGFFNVCRHHAAAVMTQPHGRTAVMRCPYHGWTYELDGCLKGAPEFGGVCDFDAAGNGLVPLSVETWERFVFVRVGESGPALKEFLGEMADGASALGLDRLRFFERREYELACNWKVFVDNYLDGGYHVPHVHKGLGSILDYAEYTIETKDRFCLQSSPIREGKGEAQTASVRRGDRACYWWLYPNFMLNWYEGVCDTNLALPLDVDRCRVIFDFYFESDLAGEDDVRRRSIDVAHTIQQEDIDVCESVQRGLHSRAYDTGRLSVRREAGEHHFHRLLHADLLAALAE